MYLLFDNTNSEDIAIYCYLNNKWVQHIYPSKTYNLTIAIDQCLKEEKLTPNDINGLAVLVGRGSFTATRIAVTVANTMAYSLNIPVTTVEKLDNLDEVRKKIEGAFSGVLISAVYSGEPNLGKKKI